MGGYGSTRWRGHDAKETVEDCLTLSAKGLLRTGVHARGTVSWLSRTRLVEVASVEYEMNTLAPPAGWLRLAYRGTTFSGVVDYRIPLMVTRPNYGGLRWWFCCPECGHKAGKLYLPYSASSYFLCRACHVLTYESCHMTYRYTHLTVLPLSEGCHERMCTA